MWLDSENFSFLTQKGDSHYLLGKVILRISEMMCYSTYRPSTIVSPFTLFPLPTNNQFCNTVLPGVLSHFRIPNTPTLKENLFFSWREIALQYYDCFCHQFSSVAQSCPTLCDPMNRSTPGLPVHHHILEFTQTHVHQVRDANQASHPLSSPSPPAPNPSQHQSLLQ